MPQSDRTTDWQLDPLKAVAPQLRLILRARIIRNDLKPLSRLSEPELARIYGVSRQPVREALITLEHQGLVEVRPQRGTYVKPIDLDAVLNGRFVREAVEADIVRRLARDADASLVRELRQQIEHQRKAAQVKSMAFVELDETFHQTLAEAAGVAKAWRYLQSLKAQMDRVRFNSFVEFPLDILISQHCHIVDMIEANDVASAEKTMREHLRMILNALPTIQKRYPDHFEGVLEDGYALKLPDPAEAKL